MCRLIGDEVNLASRLEAMCKQYGVAVLISGSLYALVCHRFLVRPIDRVVAVGKQRAVDIYELVGELDSATPEDRRRCSDFEAVVEAYRARDFARALALAEAFAGAFPGDVAARKYAERCRCFMECPPNENWDGTFVLTSK
jgi:adenylate cyclase